MANTEKSLSEIKPSNIFEKKQRKTKFALLGIALAAGFIFKTPITETASQFANWINDSIQGSIIGFGIIGIIAFIASDKRVRRLIKYSWNSLVKKITSLFTELDPIKILEKYVEDLDNNYRALGENISKLRIQIDRLKENIKVNNNEIIRSHKLIAEAQRQGRPEVVAVNSNQIGRLDALNKKYGSMVSKLEDLNSVLIKMHTYSSYKLTDTRNEIRMKKQEYNAISSGYSAMRNAQNILQGNFQQTELYDRATQELAADLSLKIADMDNFMALSSDVFKEMDFQNSIYQTKGMEIFDKITTEGKAFLDKIEYSKESYLPQNDPKK
ncbi:MAG: hypothetical protein IKQ46_08170 [Bacteroidales bacterium]|nr:hypothetical protein [Bacteroidales bacterium]